MSNVLDLGLEGQDYDDIRALGEGGMGDIFLAHKKRLDIDVVIKRTKKGLAGRLDSANEAEILKGIRHQYLPRIYDIIQSPDGSLNTVMDYIPGEDMLHYVRSHGTADQAEAYRWAQQLCEVVSYLHSQKPPIIHCDIKPRNVMIMPNGNICLIDFNTSLLLKDHMKLLGLTNGYAAPEQYHQRSATSGKPVSAEETVLDGTAAGGTVADVARADATVLDTTAADEKTVLDTSIARAADDGTVLDTSAREQGSTGGRSTGGVSGSSRFFRRNSSFGAATATTAQDYGEISPRTDVYSIGATLYFALTGNTPERSLDEVTPLSSFDLPVSPVFVAIIERAMAKNQEERFPSADEMLRALHDVDKMDSRFSAFSRKKRVAYAAIVLLWALGAGCLSYAAVSARNARENNYQNLVAQARDYDAQGQYSQAEEVLREATSMSPEQVDSYLILAEVYYHEGNYQLAIDTLDNALSSGSVSKDELSGEALSAIYYIKGCAYSELGNTEDALRAQGQAVSYDADNEDAILQKALMEAKSGMLSDAIESLGNLTDQARASFVQAEVYQMQGDVENAIDSYGIAIESLDDMDLLLQAYLDEGKMLAENQRYDEQIDLLQEGAQRLGDGKNALLKEALAEAYGTRNGEGDAQREITLLRELRESGRNDINIGLNLSAAYQNTHDFDSSLEVLRELQTDYPYDYRVDMRLAFVTADQQSALSREERDYRQVLTYYQTAEDKYVDAQARGIEDENMVLLRNTIDQLRAAGWLQ